MNTKYAVCLQLLMVFVATVNAELSVADEVDTGAATKQAVSEVYLPGYSTFAFSTQQLAGSIKTLCHEASAASLRQSRDNFDTAVRSFSVIELYRVGPMLSNNRQNRIFYWPDKRRAGERQLRALLASVSSSTVQSISDIGSKSVAVQGFPALERLLYDRAASDQLSGVSGDGGRCLLAQAIALNIAEMASELRSEWLNPHGISYRINNPAESDELFRSEGEVLRSFITQIIAGIEFLAARKVEPLLSDYSLAPSARGTLKVLRKMPFWKSENYLTNLEGNINGIRALILDSGLAALAELHSELAFEFTIAASHLKKLNVLDSLVDGDSAVDHHALELIEALAVVLRSIQFTVTDRLASTLGVHAGFNSDDGD